MSLAIMGLAPNVFCSTRATFSKCQLPSIAEAMRADMSGSERADHDEAWGLDFGDPTEVLIVPPSQSSHSTTGLLKRLFSRKSASPNLEAEHPMSENMASSLAEHLDAQPTAAEETDAHGLTMLHHLALAGSTAGVKTLLAHGAAKDAKTARGKTAGALAAELGWSHLQTLLPE